METPPEARIEPFTASAAELGLSETAETPLAREAVVYGIKDTETVAAEHSCAACGKCFTTSSSLYRHYNRYPTCVEWIELGNGSTPSAVDVKAWWDELFKTTAEVADAEKPTCSACKGTFSNRSNLHKHFQSATVCGGLIKCRLIETIKALT
jgi:hypothetical protein